VTFSSKCDSQKNDTEKKKSISTNDTTKSNKTAKNTVQSPTFNCDYMDQEPPGNIPVKFAPEILSTKKDDSCFEISLSGKEMIFTREGKILLATQNENKIWSTPSPFSFAGGETSFSKNGKLIYYNSRDHFPGANVALNMWKSEKINGQWGKPEHLGAPLINQTIHAPSVVENGNIYASGLVRFKYENGKYQEAEKLTPDIKGSHPFIAPDESYIIFDKRPQNGSYGADLFITYQKNDGSWTQPVPLNDSINTSSMETNAYVTPDRKYMFFTRNFDIYWVKCNFVQVKKK